MQRIAAIALCATLISFAVWAQIPTPQPVAQQPVPVPATPAETPPPVASDGTRPVTEADLENMRKAMRVAPARPVQEDRLIEEVKSPEQIAEEKRDEAARQSERQVYRQQELDEDGFKWIPWNDAGKKVWDFVRDRGVWVLVAAAESENHTDIAVYDLDGDNKPDILVNIWDEKYCGTAGCSFFVLFDDKNRRQKSFRGDVIRPYEKGIMLDHKAYYSN